MPWLNQNKIVELLLALESCDLYGNNENVIKIAKLRVKDESLLKSTLKMNFKMDCYMGPAPERLPIVSSKPNGAEYSVVLPNNSKLAWTPLLTDYINQYNILPSKEFFERMNLLLQCCQGQFKQASDRLVAYLNENPLPDKTSQVLRQRM
jgi:hypothetical protein